MARQYQQPNTTAQSNDSIWTYLGCGLVVLLVLALLVVMAGVASAQGCADAWEPDDAAYETSRIIMGSVLGEVHTLDHPNDLDFYRLSLQAGDTITVSTFDLLGATDTKLYLYDLDTNLVAINDDCHYPDPAACLHYKATRTGEYLVKAKDFYSRGYCGLGYTISITISHPYTLLIA